MTCPRQDSPRPSLSILVPVFDWDARPLLQAIIGEVQLGGMAGDVEVVVIDDASVNGAVRDANERFLDELAAPFLSYERLRENQGRAVVRNLLAARARGEFLLFLDCDVLPDDPSFVARYLHYARGGEYDVVCGGISYRTRVLAGPEFDYHAYLGSRKEVKGAAERNREPWRFILTSNIMVRKSVFHETAFDERFSGYGYEDIEWGLRLARDHRILHIDNSASHLGLVTKARAYEKMRASVPNYLLLREIAPDAFASSVVGKLAESLATWSKELLSFSDRMLGRLFLAKGIGNRLAFLFFQVNFAMLLALELKARMPHGGTKSPKAGI